MPPDPNEVGITNLGWAPPNMTFLEAVTASRPQRKYAFNPGRISTRLTLCNFLRHAHRETEKLPAGPERDAIQEYLAASFDAAKRMDARMKELKGQC